jgi:predicted permease
MTRATAAADLDSIARRDEANRQSNSRFGANLTGPADEIRFQDSLVMLSVAVALVLLIACANVAHLLLARAATRRREMAIRVAVGAGSERLFRQLLTESMILSLAGCLGGLLFAWAGLRVLLVARPESLSELGVARMDGMTLLITMFLSVVTGIAFGLVGAMQARSPAHEALKAGSLTSSEGRTQGRARGLLVITEMALCTTLLIGAALLLRSVVHLQNRDLGFDANNLYALNVELPRERYAQQPAVAAFFDELSTRMRAVPGVEGVARASAGPLGMSFSIGALQLEGQPDPPAGTSGFVPYNKVDTNFFKLMGVRLVEGTTFTDTSAAAAQVLVNEGFARKHWPRQSAIGRKLRIVYAGQGEWKTVVGVASNALTQGLAEDPGEPLIYMAGRDAFSPTLIVRTAGDARTLPALGGIVTSIDGRLPPARINSVELAMQKSIAGQRFTMFLLMIFTCVAVGLAAVGLYGVLAYSVSQRSREIGIRIALGASRRTIARSVMSQGLLLAGIGAIVGIVAARWGVKLVATMLYGVRQTDGVSFVASAVVLLLVAAVACLVPMRRALSVDPLIAMRAD